METLKKELVDAMRKELEELQEKSPLEIYWDYNEELSKDQIKRILEGEIYEVENDIYEMNLDYIYEMEMERLKEVFDSCNDDDSIEFEDCEDELRDEFLDFLGVDLNIKGLINSTGPINVRIEMVSNYDCINSHYFETSGSGGYEYEASYFGDMVNALNLNPAKVKKMLQQHDVKCFGRWPNIKSRDGKEYVSYDDFYQELVNSCCGANLLVFLGTLNLEDFLNTDGEIDKVIVPKGNNLGLYSSCYGGGSVLEMILQKDIELSLKVDNYNGYVLTYDLCGDGYSVDSVYGLTKSAWGEPLKVVTRSGEVK